MNDVHGTARATFDILGTVADKQARANKDGHVWKHAVYFIVPGSTVEVVVSREDFERIIVGDSYAVTGRVCKDGRFWNLFVEKIQSMSSVAKSRSAVG